MPITDAPDGTLWVQIVDVVVDLPKPPAKPSVTVQDRKEIDSGSQAVAAGAELTYDAFASWTPSTRRRIIAVDYWIGVTLGDLFESDVMLSREATRALALTSGNNTLGLFHIHKHSDAPYLDGRMDIFPEGITIEAGDTLYGNGYAHNIGASGGECHLSISVYHVPG